jgi:hypothetical protein
MSWRNDVPLNELPCGDFETKQLAGCVHLARRMARHKVDCAIVWRLGDCPYVTLRDQPAVHVCFGDCKAFDIWGYDEQKMTIVKSGLSLNEAEDFLLRLLARSKEVAT